MELLRRVKKAMISYDAQVRADDAAVAVDGSNSTATEGNMLEALHLALVQVSLRRMTLVVVGDHFYVWMCQ